jgi:MSHA pilin protein MshA
MFKATQRGFTLIELVVVIVILGILAAFALPRFMGLETQARAASVRALEGSLRSAAAMAHSVYVATGSTAATMTLPGVVTPINVTQTYPNRNSIALTLQDGVIDTAVAPAAPTPGRFTSNGNGTFTLNGATNANTCRVVYANAAANNSPVITATVGGC